MKKVIVTVIFMCITLFSALCAKAETGTSGDLSYGSYQYSAHQWNIWTGSNQSVLAISCSGTGVYFTSTSRNTASVSCGNGNSTTHVSAYMTNTYGYGWYRCISKHTVTESDGSVLTKSNWAVYGTYVY